MPLGGRAAEEEWGLTRRERQALLLLADGATSAQIAHAMGLKSDTVDQYVNSARRKLGAQNRIELVSYAVRKGILEIDGTTRLVVWEVVWAGPDEVEELILRYQPRDMVRRYPEFRDRTDRAYSDLIPDWRTQLAPSIEALIRSRGSDDPVRFEGEVDAPQPAGRIRFDGSVEPLGESRFLLQLDSSLPE
ncbi:MAG: response regulator transcription factor [Solirubrobacterales bacterium]